MFEKFALRLIAGNRRHIAKGTFRALIQSPRRWFLQTQQLDWSSLFSSPIVSAEWPTCGEITPTSRVQEANESSWILRSVYTASDRHELTSTEHRSILFHMVNYQAELDRTFAALSDPTRRAILTRLERDNSATVSHLASRFSIKLPAVMKHLGVLDEAGLITRAKSGRTVTVRLRAEPMKKVSEWLQRYERFWTVSLDRLAAHAESQESFARDAEKAAPKVRARKSKPRD